MRVAFTLTDGGPYDADGAANGEIVATGAPVALALALVLCENATDIDVVDLVSDTVIMGDSMYSIVVGVPWQNFEKRQTLDTDVSGRPAYTVQVLVQGSVSGADIYTKAVSLVDDPEVDGLLVGLSGSWCDFEAGAGPVHVDPWNRVEVLGSVVTDTVTDTVAASLTVQQDSGPTDGRPDRDADCDTDALRSVLLAGHRPRLCADASPRHVCAGDCGVALELLAAGCASLKRSRSFRVPSPGTRNAELCLRCAKSVRAFSRLFHEFVVVGFYHYFYQAISQ
jgi:hypothetical protein